MNLAGILIFLLVLLAPNLVLAARQGRLGVNWGNMASHRLPDDVALRMLQASNITMVKLFDAEPSFVQAFAHTGVEIMIGLPNDMLMSVATHPRAAVDWVKANVSRHLPAVKIRYVAIGNEPFLKAYNATYEPYTLPALMAVQSALDDLRLANPIKAVVPLNADVLSNGGSILPSAGTFRPDIQQDMETLVAYLNKQQSPFVVNIYPFLSMQQDPNFPEEFAFMDGLSSQSHIHDGNLIYKNVLEASYDLLVTSLTKNGYPDMPIIVGEVGWPTDGEIHATPENARRFNQGLLNHVLSGRGTPLRPGPLDVYIFALVDEDQKSILPGNFERHWGVYRYDGRPKYELTNNQGRSMLLNASRRNVEYLPSRWCVLNPETKNLSNLASSIAYACAYADCTALAYGGSCNNIGSAGNASYAFNSYYQITNQRPESCAFGGLAMVTTTDPSGTGCTFPIQIDPTGSTPRMASFASSAWPGAYASVLVPLLVLLLTAAFLR